MDRKSVKNPEISELIRLSEQARASLTTDVAKLRHQLDLPTRFRSSPRQYPGQWMLGSLASGLCASLLLTPRRKPEKPHQAAPERKRRALPTLLGLAVATARPFAKAWLSQQASHLLHQASTAKRTPAPHQTH